MATAKTYVGVSSKAQNVNKIYVGVSGKARRVIKAYAGVGNVARLVYTADWWRPPGVSLANCIAAWQFKKAPSQTAALKDITGHGYKLTLPSTAAWSSTKGIYKSSSGNAFIFNSSLGANNILSYIVWFQNWTPDANGSLAINLCGGTKAGRIASFLMGAGHVGTNNSWDSSSAWASQPAFFYDKNEQDLILAKSNLGASNVVGVSVADKAMYKDGALMTVKDVAHDRTQEPINPSNPQDLVWSLNGAGSAELLAISFYAVTLTQEQHKAVYRALTAL
ncbi:MAG: hypothetical protein J6W04_00140 [Bacteroidales bacterium]|nr:hypothetical protein [Bacteroidales bacterium]